MRISGDLGILAQKLRRSLGDHEINVLPASNIAGVKNTSFPREVEGASRFVEINPPPLAHQPRNRIASSQDAQVVTRSISHPLRCAAPIQWMGAWPKPINGRTG